MMDSSRSVSSRRSHSSRRSFRSTRSRSRRRGTQISSGALLNGLDELDLRVAALVKEENDRNKLFNDTFSFVGDNSISIASIESRASQHSQANADCKIGHDEFLITNIVQMSQQSIRDRVSTATITGINSNVGDSSFHSKGRSNRSVSTGRSVKSSRSHSSNEVREAEIARTVLRQSRAGPGEDDNVSVVSTYTTDNILAELNDNEDCISVRSSKSHRSQRSRRSRSSTASRQGNRSFCYDHMESPSRVKSSTRSRSKTRSKSVMTRKVRLKDTDSGVNDETQRLYNAFMKNLSREQKVAHDTRVLSNASNMRADISAGALAQNREVHNGIDESAWSIHLFENCFEHSSECCNNHEKDAIAARSTSLVPELQRSDVQKTTLSRLSSAPEPQTFNFIPKVTKPTMNSSCSLPGYAEEFGLEPFDPEVAFDCNNTTSNTCTRKHQDEMSNVFNSEGLLITADTKRDTSTALSGWNIDTSKENIAYHGKEIFEAQPSPANSSEPRFIFTDKTNICRAAKKTFKTKDRMIGSPARDAIAPTRVRPPRSLMSMTSEKSFVPRIPASASRLNIGCSSSRDVVPSMPQTRQWDAFRRQDNKHGFGEAETDFVVGTEKVEGFFTVAFPDPFSTQAQHNSNEARSENESFASIKYDIKSSKKNRIVSGSDFNVIGVCGWQGFDASNTFETISSGWETDCTPSSHVGLRSSPKNTSMTSAWSDSSPSGIVEFHSGDLQTERDDVCHNPSRADLFSNPHEAERNEWL